ncbi:hypothetical protein AB4403_15575, partial [Vibrio breoganii]
QDDACAALCASLRLKRIRHAGSHAMAIQYLSGCEYQTLALSKILNRVQDDVCVIAQSCIQMYSSCWKPCNGYPVS